MKVGLQLFTIRDAMEKNMDAALRSVKEMGYDYVEFARFYDRTAEEICEMLDKYNLKCISVHQHISVYETQGEEIIEFIKKLGAKYWVIPKIPTDKHKGSSEWEHTKKSIMELSKALKKHDITLAYHNHEHEFNRHDGKYLLDWFFEEISSDIVQPQLDVCWVRYAEEDPAEYIRKYAGRMDTIHFRDFMSERFGGILEYEYRSQNGFCSKPVGYGIQDFSKIKKAAEEAGIEYIFVESESEVNSDAELSRSYLKNMGL